jgi:hypothetical protein
MGVPSAGQRGRVDRGRSRGGSGSPLGATACEPGVPRGWTERQTIRLAPLAFRPGDSHYGARFTLTLQARTGPGDAALPGRLLTLDEAAALLGTTPLLVEQWVAQGLLRTTLVLPERVLRLSRREVLVVVEQQVKVRGA